MPMKPSPNSPGGASASALMAQLRAAGATHAVTVPDFVQFALHEQILKPDSGIKNVYACSEDQALTTATGLYVGGARPFVMVQNQGLYKCFNTLRATCIDSAVPMVFFVGTFGREPENIGQSTRSSGRSMVRVMEPFLEAIGVRYWTVTSDEEAARVAEAFAHAQSAETAAVVLIDRHVTWN